MILNSSGQPYSKPVAMPDIGGADRTEKLLSLRAAEIVRSTRLWCMRHRLTPDIVCRFCYDKHLPQNPYTTGPWQVEIASTPSGQLLLQCGCSSWICTAPVGLDSADTQVVPAINLALFGKKQQPIAPGAARLIHAWEQVLRDNHWIEHLSCLECGKNDSLNAFCRIKIVREKDITIECRCCVRRFVDETK